MRRHTPSTAFTYVRTGGRNEKPAKKRTRSASRGAHEFDHKRDQYAVFDYEYVHCCHAHLMSSLLQTDSSLSTLCACSHDHPDLVKHICNDHKVNPRKKLKTAHPQPPLPAAAPAPPATAAHNTNSALSSVVQQTAAQKQSEATPASASPVSIAVAATGGGTGNRVRWELPSDDAVRKRLALQVANSAGTGRPAVCQFECIKAWVDANCTPTPNNEHTRRLVLTNAKVQARYNKVDAAWKKWKSFFEQHFF